MFGLHKVSRETRKPLHGNSEWPALVRMAGGAVAGLLIYAAIPANVYGQNEQEPPLPASPRQQLPADKQQNLPAQGAAQTATGAESGAGSPQAEAQKDSPEAIRKRAEWFYKQRSSVNGRIPAGARLHALEHMQRRMEAEGKLVRRPDGSYAPAVQPPAGATWTSIGPTPTTGGTFSPVTGRITTIAVDPTDSSGNTVLIGGAQGGIWHSTDAGATWTPVGDQNASLAMGSIAFAPSSPKTVYAGTGEQAGIGFDIYYGAGVLKSTDGGLTWAQTCSVAGTNCPFIGPYTDAFFGASGFGYFTFGGARISYVSVSPSSANLVLAAAQFVLEGPQEGVYCSDDGGSTWTNVLPDEMATFVGFASSGVAYAALGNFAGSSPGAPNGNGIYKATGIGSACASIKFKLVGGTGLPAQSDMGRIDLGIAPGNANTIYASISNAGTASQTNLGVYMTTDGGTNWVQTGAPDVCKDQCWYDNVVKVDPTTSQSAFFGGSAVVTTSGSAPSWVVRTQNGGTNWSSVIPNSSPGDPGVPHVDSHAMAFVKLPGGTVRLYLGNDGGIWRTDDAEAATVTWINLNNGGLTLSQFYPSISIHPSSSQVAFGGTQDNGSQNYQGGTAWVDNGQCGDGTATAIDAQIPSTVYVICPNFGSGFPLFASYQGGATGSFILANNGINPADSSNFVAPLAVDPSTPDIAYFGTNAIYQTFDAGNTWSSLPLFYEAGTQSIFTTLAVAPGNSTVAYAGTAGGEIYAGRFLLPPNSGDFGEIAGIAPGEVPSRAVTGIAIDPSDSTGGTAYFSFSGFSFVGTDVLGNMVNDPTGHVFKITQGNGPFVDVSCSVANCSTPGPTDLPNIPVNDLLLDPDVPRILYAATDLGVYVGNCSATPCTWSTLGTGLPHVAVLSLRLHEASRTLRAATHGRGVWDLALNNFMFTGPRIVSLSPLNANAGGGAQVTLTINGTGLTGGTVQWNGATTGVTTQTGGSDTTLTATIDPSLLISGPAIITVNTASATSNAVSFDVLAQTPTLTGVSPPGVPVQTPNPSSSAQIQVTGTNFASTAKVYFNGARNGISTTFNTSSGLTATLPPKLLGPYGSTNDISVINLPPGGGKSQTQTLRILAPPPPNDNIANATNITGVQLTDIKDTSAATTESTDPVPPCVQQVTPGQGNTGGHPNGAYNTMWYQYTPAFSSVVGMDTTGSSYDTVLSLWSGAPGNLSLLGCGHGVSSGPGNNLQSQVGPVSLNTGTTYYIMVSSFGPPDPNPQALGGKSVLNFYYNGGYNPQPTITSISPTSASSGGPSFMLTLNGSTFLNGAYVTFSNDALQSYTTESTTFVSSTELTATIQASDIVLPGTGTIYVFNPQPTLAPSNSKSFPINVGTYPAPILNTISPASVIAGSVPFVMSVQGADFASTAKVQVNGVPVQSTFEGSGLFYSTIPTSAVATAGTAQVTVVNPGPGGGPSAPLQLTIAAPTVVPTISSISPSTLVAGTPPLTVTVTGTNFQSGISAFFGYYFYPNVVTSTQLTFSSFQVPIQPGTYPLYVVDPAPGGASAPFNIMVTSPPDFTLMPTVSSVTVNAGQPANFPITIAATGGFAGNVSLGCGPPAPGTTCSANPNPVAAGGTSTVTVTTTARGLLVPDGRGHGPRWPVALPVVLIILVFSLLALRGLPSGRRRRWTYSLPMLLLVLYFVLHGVGCGGGGSGSSGGGGGGGNQNGTPPGNWPVVITATSGSTQHQITLFLLVN